MVKTITYYCSVCGFIMERPAYKEVRGEEGKIIHKTKSTGATCCAKEMTATLSR